jgi:hypothetical protein
MMQYIFNIFLSVYVFLFLFMEGFEQGGETESQGLAGMGRSCHESEKNYSLRSYIGASAQ